MIFMKFFSSHGEKNPQGIFPMGKNSRSKQKILNYSKTFIVLFKQILKLISCTAHILFELENRNNSFPMGIFSCRSFSPWGISPLGKISHGTFRYYRDALYIELALQSKILSIDCSSSSLNKKYKLRSCLPSSGNVKAKHSIYAHRKNWFGQTN